MEKNLVFLILSEKKIRFQQKSMIFCISLNTQFSHQKTVFFLIKRKQQLFLEEQPGFAPDIIGFSQKVGFANFGQNVKMACHRPSLLI